MVTENNIIRVDRNMADKAIEWFNKFDSDASLCFDIMLYISKNCQRDLFNYGIIDLSDFATSMGYHKNNLQAYCTKPIQASADPNSFNSNERHDKFVTVFENALFKLGLYNLPIHNIEYDKEKDETILSTTFVQIIKEIKIHISQKASEKSKISYTYVTSKEFDYNISRLFFLADFSLITELRNKNLLLLYFYFKSIENSNHHTYTEKDFGKLCNFAGLKYDENAMAEPGHSRTVIDCKQRLKRRKLDELKKFINFDYEEIKLTGHKYKYGFLWIFPNNSPFLADGENKSKKALKDAILSDAKNNYILIRLLKFYRSLPGNKTDKDFNKFFNWFQDHSQDMKMKTDIYMAAIKQTFKKQDKFNIDWQRNIAHQFFEKDPRSFSFFKEKPL